LEAFHCSATYVVPVSVTESTGAVGGRRSRAADNGDDESSATTTTAAHPIAWASFRASGVISDYLLEDYLLEEGLRWGRIGAQSAVGDPTAGGSRCQSFVSLMTPTRFRVAEHGPLDPLQAVPTALTLHGSEHGACRETRRNCNTFGSIFQVG